MVYYVFNNNLFNQTMIAGDKMFLSDPIHDVNIIKARWETLPFKEHQV